MFKKSNSGRSRPHNRSPYLIKRYKVYPSHLKFKNFVPQRSLGVPSECKFRRVPFSQTVRSRLRLNPNASVKIPAHKIPANRLSAIEVALTSPKSTVDFPRSPSLLTNANRSIKIISKSQKTRLSRLNSPFRLYCH